MTDIRAALEALMARWDAEVRAMPDSRVRTVLQSCATEVRAILLDPVIARAALAAASPERCGHVAGNHVCTRTPHGDDTGHVMERVAAASTQPERCAHVWPSAEQPHDRCGRCGAPACPSCGGYGEGCEKCHGEGYSHLWCAACGEARGHNIHRPSERYSAYHPFQPAPAASPEPERCPVCGDIVATMGEHADGSDPTGHRRPAAPTVEALRERLHDAICTMPKPHGCHAYEALRALEAAARADERTRMDAPLTVDYGDTTCPETHVDGYCNACGPLDLSAFLSRGAALLERVEWENPDDEAAAERWVNRASFAALAEQGR